MASPDVVGRRFQDILDRAADDADSDTRHDDGAVPVPYPWWLAPGLRLCESDAETPRHLSPGDPGDKDDEVLPEDDAVPLPDEEPEEEPSDGEEEAEEEDDKKDG